EDRPMGLRSHSTCADPEWSGNSRFGTHAQPFGFRISQRSAAARRSNRVSRLRILWLGRPGQARLGFFVAPGDGDLDGTEAASRLARARRLRRKPPAQAANRGGLSAVRVEM